MNTFKNMIHEVKEYAIHHRERAETLVYFLLWYQKKVEVSNETFEDLCFLVSMADEIILDCESKENKILLEKRIEKYMKKNG